MKNIYTLGSIAALLMIQLIGCGDNRSVVAGSEASSDLQINIKLGKIAVDRIASAEVIITGSGWAGRTETLSVSGNAISGTVRQLPAGANRKFVLNCYDAAGSLAYTGETTADVVAGQLVSISIRLLAVSGGSDSTSTADVTIVDLEIVGAPTMVRGMVDQLGEPWTTDQYGEAVRVRGEVRNTGNVLVTGAQLRVVVRDAAGNLVARKDAISTMPESIQIGDTAVFEVIFDGIYGFLESDRILTVDVEFPDLDKAGSSIEVPEETGVESGSTVVLTIRSPVVANYRTSYTKSSTTITGEIENPSSQTATAVNVVFTPRNASGGAMGQYTHSVGSLPPGSKFFSVLFGDKAYAKEDAPISTIDYLITHSLGGPDTGNTSVSAN